jgi:hypothetical protein
VGRGVKNSLEIVKGMETERIRVCIISNIPKSLLEVVLLQICTTGISASTNLHRRLASGVDHVLHQNHCSQCIPIITNKHQGCFVVQNLEQVLRHNELLHSASLLHIREYDPPELCRRLKSKSHKNPETAEIS